MPVSPASRFLASSASGRPGSAGRCGTCNRPSAGEIGVFGPGRVWPIEGHGVDPDIVVDNLPHATFKGEMNSVFKGPADLILTIPLGLIYMIELFDWEALARRRDWSDRRE